MISLEKVTKKFGNKIIMDNADFAVGEGEKVTIIGPSGCGKSTTLRLILRLQPLNGGRVFVDDEDISTLNTQGLVALRLKFGMVFQSSALFDSMTVGENVGFGLRQNTDYDNARINRIVAEKLDMVGLAGQQKKMPAELSGGMQKRVAFARAIATNPKIMLYDEPTTGLDPVMSTVIENLINKLNRELNITSIIVTHQLSTIYNTSDRIYMMHAGQLLEAGSPEQARVSSNPVISSFLGGTVLQND